MHSTISSCCVDVFSRQTVSHICSCVVYPRCFSCIDWLIGTRNSVSFPPYYSTEHPGPLPLPPAKKLNLKTKPQQKGASGFTASSGNIASGLGTTPYALISVPQEVEGIFWDGKVEEPPSSLFKELKITLQKNRIAGPMSLVKVSETDGRGQYGYTVQAMFLDGIAKSAPFARKMTTERPPFRDGLESSTRRNLGHLGLTAGITSEASFMDGYLHADSNIHKAVPTSVFEVKNDCTAPKEGNLEAIAHATNVAMGLVAKGFAPEEVVVPVFSSNGRLLQVSAVYFLPQSTFPVVCFLTTVLDLFDDQGLNLAATALSKMLAHCDGTTQRLTDLGGQLLSQNASLTMELNLSVYFTKPLSRFCPILGDSRVNESVARLFTLTSVLRGRRFACPPLAYRLQDTTNDGTSSIGEDVIVFEKLVGFQIGFPADSDERQQLFDAMKASVSEFHSLGLVHVDLYLSNIMWKKNGDAYDVRIVDFDSIHEKGEQLSPVALERLQSQGFDPAPTTANQSLDELYLEVLGENIGAKELAYQGDQERARVTMDTFFRTKLAERNSQPAAMDDEPSY